MIDTFVDTGDTTLWYARQMNVPDKIRLLDYDIQTKEYFVAVSQKSRVITDKKAFLEKFDLCLRKMKASGKYSEIASKCGLLQ